MCAAAAVVSAAISLRQARIGRVAAEPVAAAAVAA
jgi:hypothetical protein